MSRESETDSMKGLRPGDVVYRADTVGPFTGCRYNSHIEEWEVLRLTPKGMWIVLIDCITKTIRRDEKWVSFRTRFVSTTREYAYCKAVARKRAYVRHAMARVEGAKSMLKCMEKALEEYRKDEE